MTRPPNYPLRLDPLRRAGWKRAAELEGRTLAGWIKSTCDRAAGQTLAEKEIAVRSFQAAAELPDRDEELEENQVICGETIEHDIDQEDFNEEGTCIYWHCRRCDAEWFSNRSEGD